METRELILKAREKGITIKQLANIANINLSTLYNYNCGRNLSKEKEEKLNQTLSFLLSMLDA